MSYLLYCVFETREQEEPPNVSGVDGVPVVPVTESGLCAAVSRLTSSGHVPGMERAMAYKRVVETLHRDRTLIPMRYGCVLEREAGIRQFLAERRDPYRALLRELDGHTEMGVRVLCRAMDEGGEAACADRRGPGPVDQAPGAGRRYLEMRRSALERQGALEKQRQRLTCTCLDTFHGFYTRFHRDEAPAGSPVVSLYFLVPRKLVAGFRARFRSAVAGAPVKMLLSGPWPPYNFVLPETSEPGAMDAGTGAGSGPCPRAGEGRTMQERGASRP